MRARAWIGLAIGIAGVALVVDPGFATALAWTVVLSGFGGYGFYWLAAARFGASGVSSLLYLLPATTATWAWLMLGDPIAASNLLGLGVSLLGLVLIRWRPSSETRARA